MAGATSCLPKLFRRKSSRFQATAKVSGVPTKQKGMEGLMNRSSGGGSGNGNFLSMMELRKKIMIFRDIFDIPPLNGSVPIHELVIGTAEDLHRMYPEMIPCIPTSKLKERKTHQGLICFYGVLKCIGDSSWIDDPKVREKFKYGDVENIPQDELVKTVVTTLDCINKATKERFDLMEEDEPKSDYLDDSRSISISRSSSDHNPEWPYPGCGSPRTPTSVLPESPRFGDYGNLSLSPPRLWGLRVQAVERLSPSDWKRLSVHMMPHLAALANSQKNTDIDESKPKIEDSKDGKDGKGGKEEKTIVLGESDMITERETGEVVQKGNLTSKIVDPNERETQELLLPLPKSPLRSELLSKAAPTPPPVTLPSNLPVLSPIKRMHPSPSSLPSSPPPSNKTYSSPPPSPPTNQNPPSLPVAIPPPPPPPLTSRSPPSPPPPPPGAASPPRVTPPPPPPTGAAPPPPPPPGAAPSPPPPPPGASRNRGPPPPPLPMGKKGGAPPPPPPGKGGAAPPPPPGAGQSLRPNKTTKLKRSSHMGNLYRLLKGKVEGSCLTGKSSPSGKKGSGGNGGDGGGGKSMADALAEMTKRSAYFQQIEEDVEKHGKSIKELQVALNSFQTKDMNELINFHQHVESKLEILTDETQVISRFEGFPMKKLEALRMAAALYSKLNGIVTELQNWKIESPLGQLLDKVEKYFTKVKGELEALERTKDEESKKFQSHNIHFDFHILVKIKEAMVDVSSGCMELSLKERREAKAASNEQAWSKAGGQKKVCAKMLWRAFQFAFRVYSFAGGQDERADILTRELAQEIETDPMQE